MKKKAVVISLCSVCFAAWIFGVIYTNVRAERPVVKTYSINEPVPYESDYFRRSDNILRGYTATVLGSEILPYDAYAEKYNIDLPEVGTDEFGNPVYRPEYVYDIEVKFANTDNEDGGIDMFDTLLVNGDALMLRADEYLWDKMYPQLAGSYSFRLRPNTEKVFHIPFVVESVYSKRYSIEKIKKQKMALVISQYPVKKIIEIP